jgi:hypothetical protein
LLGEGEVGFSGFPSFGNFDQNAGDETQQGTLNGEESYDSRASFDLAVEGFTGVGSACFFAVFFGYAEDGEAFGEVGFGPGGELGLRLGIGLDEAR